MNLLPNNYPLEYTIAADIAFFVQLIHFSINYSIYQLIYYSLLIIFNG
jgi:hypothetical protein